MELNYDEIHRLKDYLTLASQNGRILINAKDHIDSKLHKFITLDFKAAKLPDYQLWQDWPRDQLIRHLLQLNPPTSDDKAKPAVTLEHQLENLRLNFNPRDTNRTGLKEYSAMLSRIRDEFKDDLSASEATHVKILMDSMKRQSSGDNKPELRELYAGIIHQNSSQGIRMYYIRCHRGDFTGGSSRFSLEHHSSRSYAIVGAQTHLI
jgi:hypothetical protein